jgi:hypothetical protein
MVDQKRARTLELSTQRKQDEGDQTDDNVRWSSKEKPME